MWGSTLCLRSLGQGSKADLAMEIFVGRSDISAAEPDKNAAAVHDDGRVANHLRIPGLCSAVDHGQFGPSDAIGRTGEAQVAILVELAHRIEHPVEPMRLPHRRLAETGLLGIELKDRVGAELLPMNAVGGT